jgi:hypothetical protein
MLLAILSLSSKTNKRQLSGRRRRTAAAGRQKL